MALPLLFAAVSAGYLESPVAYSAPLAHGYHAPSLGYSSYAAPYAHSYGHGYASPYAHAYAAPAVVKTVAAAPLAYAAPAYHAPIVKSVAYPAATSYANTYKVM